MRKSACITEISTEVTGGSTFYVHPVVQCHLSVRLLAYWYTVCTLAECVGNTLWY